MDKLDRVGGYFSGYFVSWGLFSVEFFHGIFFPKLECQFKILEILNLEIIQFLVFFCFCLFVSSMKILALPLEQMDFEGNSFTALNYSICFLFQHLILRYETNPGILEFLSCKL